VISQDARHGPPQFVRHRQQHPRTESFRQESPDVAIAVFGTFQTVASSQTGAAPNKAGLVRKSSMTTREGAFLKYDASTAS